MALLLLLGGAAAVAWPLLVGARRPQRHEAPAEGRDRDRAGDGRAAQPKKNASAVREKAAKTAHEFYAKSDPENVARLRMKLIQAGYMDPGAVGTFFLIRFGGFCRRRCRRLPGQQLDGERARRPP